MGNQLTEHPTDDIISEYPSGQLILKSSASISAKRRPQKIIPAKILPQTNARNSCQHTFYGHNYYKMIVSSHIFDEVGNFMLKYSGSRSIHYNGEQTMRFNRTLENA